VLRKKKISQLEEELDKLRKELEEKKSRLVDLEKRIDNLDTIADKEMIEKLKWEKALLEKEKDNSEKQLGDKINRLRGILEESVSDQQNLTKLIDEEREFLQEKIEEYIVNKSTLQEKFNKGIEIFIKSKVEKKKAEKEIKNLLKKQKEITLFDISPSEDKKSSKKVKLVKEKEEIKKNID